MFKRFLNKFHYKKLSNLSDSIVFIFLYPLSLVYGFIVELRLLLYHCNILKKKKVNAKVISIGNITTGGTGKTPFVVELSKYLSPNHKVAILSRGYGGSYTNKVNLVKLNNKLIANSATNVGDEAYMLANILDDVTILTGKDRFLLANEAITKYGCNLILLDDAFQHIKLLRDLDILLIDREKIFGNNHLLPVGPLREPLKSIKRADIIIIVNKSMENINNTDIPGLIQTFNKPVYFANYKQKGYLNLKDNSFTENLKESKLLAFCGIAQPEYFFNTLEGQDKDIISKIIFNDHHNYTYKDLININKTAKINSVDAIVMTEKDSVKIKQYIDIFEIPLYSTKIALDVNIEEILKNKKVGFHITT